MNMFRWSDPYDDLTDEELDEYASRSFATRTGTVAVSLRRAPEQLARLKREAARAGAQAIKIRYGRAEFDARHALQVIHIDRSFRACLPEPLLRPLGRSRNPVQKRDNIAQAASASSSA